VATPNDFGFYGKGTGEGRYAPLKKAESHQRFRADLTRMIDLLLAGRREEARAAARPAGDASLAAFPEVTLTDLQGRALSRSELAGKVVLVEFWATWCPPCRGTLRWLGQLQKQYGDRLRVVAIATESEETKVRTLTTELNLPVTWVMGRAEVARAFGDVSAVPTLHLFDAKGQSVATYFGAPPDLHAKAESRIASLLK
jgi:thiol-disulfide isomerase/thioredoxin